MPSIKDDEINTIALLVFMAMAAAFTLNPHKPVLYIIGDSTVKNGDGKQANGLQGWGSFIARFF
ncbi:MAG TPA: hypothetical protein VFV68_09945 [Agriterribacter sp.]|nr:hypothetical protein [Agriterribacter sp.]